MTIRYMTKLNEARYLCPTSPLSPRSGSSPLVALGKTTLSTAKQGPKMILLRVPRCTGPALRAPYSNQGWSWIKKRQCILQSGQDPSGHVWFVAECDVLLLRLHNSPKITLNSLLKEKFYTIPIACSYHLSMYIYLDGSQPILCSLCANHKVGLCAYSHTEPPRKVIPGLTSHPFNFPYVFQSK